MTDPGTISYIVQVAVMTLLPPVVIAVAAVMFIRYMVKRSRSAVSARNILDERYARGELDRESYERMRADIERN